MSNLTDDDKKLFFDNIHYIQKQYNVVIEELGFDVAEIYKQDEIREYLRVNKDTLLEIRKKIQEE